MRGRYLRLCDGQPMMHDKLRSNIGVMCNMAKVVTQHVEAHSLAEIVLSDNTAG
jgi:hypothetical protein